MPAKKSLGRGLGAIVSLQPVREGGSARIDEAIRSSPGPSVLALSGESFDEIVRATVANPPRHTRNGIAERVAVAPAAVTVVEEPPPPVQYALFDPQVEESAVSEEPEPLPPVPAPLPPEPQAAAHDEPVLEDSAFEETVLFLDEEIGGVVLPEVELE